MDIISKQILTPNEKSQLFSLWNAEYPEKITLQSLENLDNYLNGLTDQMHYFLLNDKQQIEAWALTFKREKEKWFAIIVSEKIQGSGIGKEMLNKLKVDEDTLNGWVIDHTHDKKRNGTRYKSPLEFYLKNGFTLIPETRLELETISAVKINWTK